MKSGLIKSTVEGLELRGSEFRVLSVSRKGFVTPTQSNDG